MQLFFTVFLLSLAILSAGLIKGLFLSMVILLFIKLKLLSARLMLKVYQQWPLKVIRKFLITFIVICGAFAGFSVTPLTAMRLSLQYSVVLSYLLGTLAGIVSGFVVGILAALIFGRFKEQIKKLIR